MPWSTKPAAWAWLWPAWASAASWVVPAVWPCVWDWFCASCWPWPSVLLLLGEVASWSWVWSLVAPEVWPWTLDCPPDCVVLSVVDAWLLPSAADWPVLLLDALSPVDVLPLPEVLLPVAEESPDDAVPVPDDEPLAAVVPAADVLPLPDAVSPVEAVLLPDVLSPVDEVSLPEVAPPVVAASLPEAVPLVDAVLLLVEPAAPVEVDAPPVVVALPSLEPEVWLLPAAWVAEEACSELEAACVDVSLPEEACVVEVPVLLLPVEAPLPVAVELPLSAVVEVPAPVVAEVPPLAAVELPLPAASEVALPACPVVAA